MPHPTPHFAFTSDTTFMKCPPGRADRPLAVAGVPWDGATTNRPGARFGPRAIRLASHMLCDGGHPAFDVSPLPWLTDLGDLALPNTSLERLREALSAMLPALLSSHHIAWLGGDHSITLSLLRAHRERLGQPLALFHFDAHCDTWTDHFGEPSGHGTWVHEAVEEGLILPSCTVQVGIRSAGEKATREYVADRGGRIHTARDLRGRHRPEDLQSIVDDFAARLERHGQPPAYLTLDIDCLDPAFAPGTGTPEPGGLTSPQLLTLIEALADVPFVGMDCVEVSPPYDSAELTSLVAAHAVWTYLSGRAARHEGVRGGTAAVAD
ncbi:MAG: agmatinase [Rubrivivax sp.]|jgi:agmatinase